MTSKDRRERERLETRERILEAAREMFAEEGVESVTMREIAKRIEYTSTAIYHHFPSKQALLTELCEGDFAELGRHFQNNTVSADPVDRLREIGLAYLRFAMEYPSHYRFMFMTMLPDVDHSEQFINESVMNPERNAYSLLRGACEQAIEQQRMRGDVTDPDMLAQILWCTIHGLVSLRMTKAHQAFVPWKDLEETTILTMDVLFRGLLRQPG